MHTLTCAFVEDPCATWRLHAWKQSFVNNRPQRPCKTQHSRTLGCGMQADTNAVVAASVVYLSNVDVDRPMSKAAWNNSHALRHFSILRKLNGVSFPAGDLSFCRVS